MAINFIKRRFYHRKHSNDQELLNSRDKEDGQRRAIKSSLPITVTGDASPRYMTEL